MSSPYSQIALPRYSRGIVVPKLRGSPSVLALVVVCEYRHLRGNIHANEMVAAACVVSRFRVTQNRLAAALTRYFTVYYRDLG